MPPAARPRRAGFVLVAMMAITALLAALVAAVSTVSRSGLETVRMEVDDLVGDALLRAGLEVAAWQLVTLAEPPRFVDGQLIRLDSGSVTVFVLPTGGWIDLNTSDPALLQAAWKAGGLKQMRERDFADRVVDWRDRDQEKLPRGAEAEDYAEAGLPFAPANDAFRRVDDLRWVLGIRPADIERLGRFFTVTNVKGTINLFEAPREVLELLPGFDRRVVDRVMRLRAKREEETVPRLLAAVPEAARPFVNADLGADRIVRLRLEARPNRGAMRTIEALIIPDPLGREAYRVVEWSEETGASPP